MPMFQDSRTTLVVKVFDASQRVTVDKQCADEHDIQTRSRNHYCLIKPINITYSECVFVAFIIQHAQRVPRVVIYVVFGCTIYFFCTFCVWSVFVALVTLNAERMRRVALSWVNCLALPCFPHIIS